MRNGVHITMMLRVVQPFETKPRQARVHRFLAASYEWRLKALGGTSAGMPPGADIHLIQTEPAQRGPP